MSEVTDIEEDISEMSEEQGIDSKIALINSCRECEVKIGLIECKGCRALPIPFHT